MTCLIIAMFYCIILCIVNCLKNVNNNISSNVYFSIGKLKRFFFILNPKKQNAFLNRTNKILLYQNNILFYCCLGLSFTQSYFMFGMRQYYSSNRQQPCFRTTCFSGPKIFNASYINSKLQKGSCQLYCPLFK